MDDALRALNRFGLGARPGERSRIGDPRRWLRAQLEGPPPTLAAPGAASPKAIAAALAAFRGAAGDRDRQRDARRQLMAIANAEVRACISERVASERPFLERLVAFWSNHLCVSTAGKAPVALLAGSYEREVIRPHVLGRFEDMVQASARHPAMLFYLDNVQSIGPGSPAARLARGNRQMRGLNENYARELLELHTLGVDGGYSQQDVLELARALTGWGIEGPGIPGGPGGRRGAGRLRGRATLQADSPATALGFIFRPAVHEPGTRTVLGRHYADAGERQGTDVIRDLCRHPATARVIATKLVAHVVADAPPAAAVDRIAGVFRESQGDLRAVSAALIDLPDAWAESSRKFRTPQDWLVAVLRAAGADDAVGFEPVALRQLRHPIWAPAAPKGFGDTLQEWADPDSLLNRAELARTLGRRAGLRGTDPARLLDVVDLASTDPLRRLVDDRSIPAAERAALAMASPAFQWR